MRPSQPRVAALIVIGLFVATACSPAPTTVVRRDADPVRDAADCQPDDVRPTPRFASWT